MKPKNFPARVAKRQGLSLEKITLARGQRSKKTPRSIWSQSRLIRRKVTAT